MNVTARVVLILLLAGVCRVARSDDRNMNQFMHTAWTAKDGAPGAIGELAQTQDGFLWLGTPTGLYRFDGLTFKHYETAANGKTEGADVMTMLVAGDRALWVGYRSGVISCIRADGIRTYSSQDGIPTGGITQLAQDHAGRIWASGIGGLARLDGNRWKRIGPESGVPGRSATAAFVDREGTLWVGTENTIVFLPMGEQIFHATGLHVSVIDQFGEARDGVIWVSEINRSVHPVANASRTEFSDQHREVRVGSHALLFARDGSLWITSFGDGLRRVFSPENLRQSVDRISPAIDSFMARDGLTDDFVRSILQDREGNIWVGTTNGLDRFTETSLVPVLLPGHPETANLSAGEDGSIWIGGRILMRVQGNNATIPSEGRHIGYTFAAYRDPTGALWWGGGFGVYRRTSNGFVRFNLPDGVGLLDAETIQIAMDRSGQLWLATAQMGLFRRQADQWRPVDLPSYLNRRAPTAACTDDAGNVLFGYADGNMVIAEGSGIEKTLLAPIGSVKTFASNRHRTWVGGEAGLSLFDGNKFTSIHSASDADFSGVVGVVETSDGSLWLAENRGVIHVPADEMKLFFKDANYRVRCQLFDSLDGLPGNFQDTSWTPREVQGVDGRIWFFSSTGLAWIDPARLLKNTLPPPVSLEKVEANGNYYPPSGVIDLPSDTRQVDIDYTALSLSVPERVRFRVRLKGFRSEWQDVGTRRHASFTMLRPGTYSFQVIASNNDGVWNTTGATLRFRIAAAWYQTDWFAGACVIAVVLAVWMAYQMRVRKIAAFISARFDERMAERTRMAQELHDTFLQTVQSSKMVADNLLASDLDHERTRKAIEKLSTWLDRAVNEARAALDSLRLPTERKDNLAEDIKALVYDQSCTGSMAVVFHVTGQPGIVHPIVRDELCHIVREALRNALQHSMAKRLQVELQFARDLTVRVKDDGVGIDSETIRSGKRGHFGLRGMRERAARVRSSFEVVSAVSHGTEIVIVVPGRACFQTGRAAFIGRLKMALHRVLSPVGFRRRTTDEQKGF